VSVRLRPALALGLATAALFAGVASATDAPKTSATSSTFFLRQEGCGTTAEPGRLEPKDSGDGARADQSSLPSTRSGSGFFGSGAGAGTVSFEVALAGTDVKGKGVDFGTTSVSGSITPGENVILVPFELAVPATAVGTPMKSFTLSVLQHGANLGYSAKHLDGDAYIVFPTKKK
jgi:hypothetical protein